MARVSSCGSSHDQGESVSRPKRGVIRRSAATGRGHRGVRGGPTMARQAWGGRGAEARADTRVGGAAVFRFRARSPGRGSAGGWRGGWGIGHRWPPPQGRGPVDVW